MRYLVLFFCSFFCFSSYATNIKIGFIDTNHVITSLTKYKSSIDLISTDFEPKKQELLDLYNHIELLRSKINLAKKSNTNENNIPFRVPSGLSFVTINNKTGLPSSDKESIKEAFIEGSEPYTKDDINILDSLGIINNSISGTGGLLTN